MEPAAAIEKQEEGSSYYKLEPPRKHTKAEIEANDKEKKGKFDRDGFYVFNSGDYYDPEGYYFNKQGFDDFGGFYDKNGDYVSPPGVHLGKDGAFYFSGEIAIEDDQYADYYDELNPDDSDDEEDLEDEEEKKDTEDGDEEQKDDDGDAEDELAEHGLEESEVNLALRREHCLPVMKWLKEQPVDKKHVIKIQNLPRRATEAMILKMLNRKIKNFKHEKLALELDTKRNESLGIAWLSSTDNYSISQLIKLHYCVSSLIVFSD